MIKIILVDDSSTKQDSIKALIKDRHNIEENEVTIARSIKAARKAIHSDYYDLMILDLVLPIEDDGECEAKNGMDFLNEIQISPYIKPPIHIVGFSGYKDRVIEFNEQFRMKLWNLIEYDETNTSWHDQLNSIIFHLVKTRQQFLEKTLEQRIDFLLGDIESKGLPNTFLGYNWREISTNLINIIRRGLDMPSKFSNGSKAKNINSSSIRISSEYDFQNLIHLLLRPWLPTMEAENIAIVFDGNTKNADFSINGNAIIIEAKYIDSTGKKNDTLKTIEGLKDFYKSNSNVRSIVFLILVDESVTLDEHKIESTYSHLSSEPYILIGIYKNKIK